MKAKILLGNKVTIKEKEVFVGTRFSINENGGMGGGHFYLYARGKSDEYIRNADGNGMVKVETLGGYTRYINLRWCNVVTETNICRVVVPLTKWNNKFGSECDYLVLDKTQTTFLDIYLEKDVEVLYGTSSTVLSVKDGCKTITEI